MLQMRGIVWSGFEANTSFFDTLPAPAGTTPLASSVDFSTIVQILYALGFNTIKIPFTFSGLAVCLLFATFPVTALKLQQAGIASWPRLLPARGTPLASAACHALAFKSL